MHRYSSTGPSLAGTSIFDDSAQQQESPSMLGSEWPASGATSLVGAATAAAWSSPGVEGGKLSSSGEWQDTYFVEVRAGGGQSGFEGPAEDWEQLEWYGADMVLPLFRRHEMLFVAWIFLLLATAAGINLRSVFSGSRQQPQVQPAALPSGPPALLMPTRTLFFQPPPRPAPPPPQPMSPAPPALNCNKAPPSLQQERFSNLAAFFPADVAHYLSNTVEKLAGTGSDGSGWRIPAYYNGAVPENCIVQVDAIYTCLESDQHCNWSLRTGRQLCESACSNIANECLAVQNLAGHPLQERVCGLLFNARPSCSGMDSSAVGVRQLQAYYRLNLCMAPPRPQPPAPPPTQPSSQLSGPDSAVAASAGG